MGDAKQEGLATLRPGAAPPGMLLAGSAHAGSLRGLPDGELDGRAGECGRGSAHLPPCEPAPCFWVTPSSKVLLPLPSPPVGFRGGRSWRLTLLPGPFEASGLWHRLPVFNSAWWKCPQGPLAHWRRRGPWGSRGVEARLCQDPGLPGRLLSRGAGPLHAEPMRQLLGRPPTAARSPGPPRTSGFALERACAGEEVTGEPESSPTQRWSHGGLTERWQWAPEPGGHSICTHGARGSDGSRQRLAVSAPASTHKRRWSPRGAVRRLPAPLGQPLLSPGARGQG